MCIRRSFGCTNASDTWKHVCLFPQYLTRSPNIYFSDKPVCRLDQKRIYGVARHEVAKVLCEVESYPPPDTFKWSFNNSAESREVPQARFHSGLHHFSSTLSYTPVGEFDYGTVMCWANNLAGLQVSLSPRQEISRSY